MGEGRWRVSVFALVLLALTGCVAMPDSGPAGPGREVVESPPEPLRVVALGPRPGAEPAEIVTGFVRAGASSDDDQVVARSFLVGAAVRAWQPRRAVVVFPDDSSLKVTVRGSGTPRQVTVTTPVLATIDESGRYQQARPGTTATAVFTVVPSGGAWRVSVVDPAFGTWLPQFSLDRTFSVLPVSFVAADTATLVPDLRWLPGPRPSLATGLVRQLLLGPPDHLGAAVVTGFPPGTTLAVDAVPTKDGVASVDLSARALSATPQMRRMLWAQLTTTLRRLPAVADLQLTVAGAPFQVPGVTSTSVFGETTFRDDVRVTGAPVVLAGDRLLRVEATTGRLIAPTATGTPAAVGLRAISVGSRGALTVAVEQSGRRLVRLTPTGPPTPLLGGRSLIDPVVDLTGSVWSADLTRPGRLVVLRPQDDDPQQPARVIAAPWWVGRAVHALDVARDGARVAIVSSGPGGVRRVDVSGVVRGPDRQPVALARPLEVARSLVGATDVAWADRTDLVLLGRAATDAAVRPYDVVVGGTTTALAPVAGARTITAGDGLRALFVTTAAGQVLARSGTGWRVVGAGRSVSVPE